MSLARALAALLIAVAAAAANAATLRWASRGDAQSMDPFAANEGVTYNLNTLVYDTLVTRDTGQRVVPHFATGWTMVDPLHWRFTIRTDARFHDGTPVTVDDVVFSIERSQQPTSQVAVFTRRLGRAVRIDERRFELRLDAPDPVLLEHLLNVMVMSRAWCRAHGAERVPAFNAGEESYASRHAMGSGAYRLVRREPGVLTVFERNTAWWGRFEGNVDVLRFTPIVADAARVAAVLSGDVDFTQDVPPQDLARLARDPAVRLTSAPENRVIFLGMDQWRETWPRGGVAGRNPLKDARVREALFRAIDVHALRASIMRGQSVPTACITTAAAGCLASELETHATADVDGARRLMAEAGLARGFELTLDCPNDRYVNDQSICVALVGMLARIGVRLHVDARPKNLFFPKVQARDTQFYLYGWGGGTIDAQVTLDPLLHSADRASGKGGDNNGGVADAELDGWIDAAAVETDVDRRAELIRRALRRVHERHYVIPLHRQVLDWLSAARVRPVILPSNFVRVDWIRVD